MKPVVFGAIVGVVFFLLGLHAIRAVVSHAIASRESENEGTWQHDLMRQAKANRRRLEGNLYFAAWSGLLGLCLCIAGIAGAVPIAWAFLGLVLVLFACGTIGARIKYNTGNVVDVLRVLRSWLRP